MTLDSLHPELARLDQIYQQTCASFDGGQLSAAEAREQILNLSYSDPDGRTWRIDTKRSGRHAAFTDEIAGEIRQLTTHIHDVQSSDHTVSATAGLAHLDLMYRQTCASFNGGQLSAGEARVQILNLSYTDPDGRTWRIDTKRSGRHAIFTDEIAGEIRQSTKVIYDLPYSAPATRPAPPTSVDHTVARQIAVPIRTRIITKSVVAILMLAAIVVFLTVDNFSATTVSVASVPVSTTQLSVPIVPQIANIASFDTIEEVPFDVDIEFGRSVRGVPLLVHRRGVADGVRVLVIGVIHGDEDAGFAVVEELRKIELDAKIDLWLVPTMNPDGQVGLKIRQNANGVDMNRNFPTRWKTFGNLGNWQYAGPNVASEPEVQAMVRLGDLIKPALAIWYHQDYFRINPSTGREGAIRERFAALVRLPLLEITGGNYSGTGAMWSRSLQDPNGITLTVELGPSPIRQGEALWNASAVMTIVREFFQDS